MDATGEEIARSRDYLLSDLDLLCVELDWKVELEGQAYTQIKGDGLGATTTTALEARFEELCIGISDGHNIDGLTAHFAFASIQRTHDG